MTEWIKCEIGDLCNTISETYRGNDEEVILVNTSDVLDGKILNHKRVKNEKLKGQFKKTFLPDDILYSEIRPANRRFAYVDVQDTSLYIASTKLMVLRCNTDIIIPKFLFAILTSQTMIDELQLRAESRSGTFPQITFGAELAPIKVNIPDKETQLKIVSVLESFQQKLETNNKINRNLSEQAQALYKSWFVDLDPFEGERPADWQDGTVDDLASEVVCGKTPSTKKEEYYGNDVPFVTIPDMHGCVYTVHTGRSLSELGAESQSKKTLPKNSICISCIGTAGLVTLLPVPSQTNQQINSIIPKNNYSPYYIYLLMSTMGETINKLGQAGSTIVNLNKTQFGKMEVLIPSIKTMSDFDEIVEPIFSAILSNQIENKKLANLRDILLPKLMSGEIDVSDLEI